MYRLRITLSNNLELVHDNIQTQAAAEAVAKDTIQFDNVTRVEVQQEMFKLVCAYRKEGITRYDDRS